MLTNLCSPLTMKIMGLGRPLRDAERVAAVMVVWVLLLCALMGVTISVAGVPERELDNGSASLCLLPGTGAVSGCGIFPEIAGTVADTARSFLHR